MYHFRPWGEFDDVGIVFKQLPEGDCWRWFLKELLKSPTLPKINIAPENRPLDSYWKPSFLRAMLVLGSVTTPEIHQFVTNSDLRSRGEDDLLRQSFRAIGGFRCHVLWSSPRGVDLGVWYGSLPPGKTRGVFPASVVSLKKCLQFLCNWFFQSKKITTHPDIAHPFGNPPATPTMKGIPAKKKPVGKGLVAGWGVFQFGVDRNNLRSIQPPWWDSGGCQLATAGFEVDRRAPVVPVEVFWQIQVGMFFGDFPSGA